MVDRIVGGTVVEEDSKGTRVGGEEAVIGDFSGAVPALW